MTCCTGNCEQGKACPNRPNPSRASLGLRPLHREFLHQQEGGETVQGKPSRWQAFAGWICFGMAAALAVAASVFGPH